MKKIGPFVVKLSNNVGDIFSSTAPVADKRFLLCDGRKISRVEFPELFSVNRMDLNEMRLPDYSKLLPGQIFFYIIASKK